MNAITQETLHHILPGKMTAIAAMEAEDHGTSPLNTLRQLYRSRMYKRLEREDTKLWYYGPVALYEEHTISKGY